MGFVNVIPELPTNRGSNLTEWVTNSTNILPFERISGCTVLLIHTDIILSLSQYRTYSLWRDTWEEGQVSSATALYFPYAHERALPLHSFL